MTDQYKNMMIALFVCAAAGVITFILLFIHPSVGNEERKLRVRFVDIDKINMGTRVTYGGKAVGEVSAVHEITGEKDHRFTHDGKVYPYELELYVDSSVHVFNSDEVTSRTSGLLGEKSVAIIPLPPKPGEKLQLIDNEVIYATEVGSVEETLRDFKSVATKLEEALDNVNRILEQMERDKTFTSISTIANNVADITEALHKPREVKEIFDSFHHLMTEASQAWNRVDHIIDNLNAAADHTREITAALDQPENLSKTVENVSDLSERAVASWDTVDVALGDIADTASNTKEISSKARDTWPAIDSAANNFAVVGSQATKAIDRVQIIIDNIASGEGTLGQLFMRDDLYLDLKAIFNKAEVIANDVNHYGLLFHLDKRWQRLRARRLNLLAQLSTPQQFRNYFNDEMDQITTSLSRVQMILEKETSLCPRGLLLDDKQFAKVYAELLRRVEGMEEALKMYNQQLVDEQLYTTELVLPICH